MAEEKKEISGWRDIRITSELPLDALINFMNVLNQRLCTLEDATKVPYDNQMISLTELYTIQAEAERKAMEEQAKAAEEKKGE